ncbi:DMT family transporter [Oryzibacter oryziterrae]|uniref:DMT family transporter n=1 Tax=Oryzibacter oryziterrae TaxID=2766474 RepID=UPI001F399EB1|nr:DMT family transporter [Oryzibacter oryziterrae]
MSPSAAGVSLKVASTLSFSVMVVLIKLVSARVPAGEVLFARAFFGIIPVLVYLMWRGEFPGSLHTDNPLGHVRRAVVGTVSMFTWFMGISYLPLPDATAISYSGPLFGVVFAALILREKVRIYRWTAVLVGFVGVMIVLSEQITALEAGLSGARAIGAALVLTSAVFAALAMVTVRELTASETTGAIVFYFSSSAAVFALTTIPFGWLVPRPMDAAIMVLAGLAGGVGQVLMTQAYRLAEASVVAPFDYANMIWIVLFSYLVFGDLPTLTVVIGSLIVIASGGFVIWRERQLGLLAAKARANEAGTPG